MYILFKSKEQKTVGPIEVYGRYLDYTVGKIADTHVDIIPFKHLSPTKLEDAVAEAWKFNAGYRGYISVRQGTLENNQLDLSFSTEDDGAKERYNLTDDDIVNAVKFIQTVLRKILDEVYDHRLEKLNLNVSNLEQSTWAKQRAELIEVKAGRNSATQAPLINALATARGISVADMATKIETAINNYDSEVKTLLASKQGIEKEIKDCATIQDCYVLMHNRFDYSMPVSMASDLGVTAASQLDL